MKLILLNKAEKIDLLNILDWELTDYELKLNSLTGSKDKFDQNLFNYYKDLKERVEHLKNKINKKKIYK